MDEGTGIDRTGAGVARLRVSDAEREAVVARLNQATGEGRLTLEEFTDRVGAALSARTRGDLDVLVDDLPVAYRGPAPVTYPAPPQDLATRVSHIVPVGSVKRRGRWRLDRDAELGTIVGSVKLDLRQAEIAAPVVHLHVRAVVGSVKVWIPAAVSVEVSGATVLGSRTVAEEAIRPGAPLLRLRVDTVVGSVKIYRR
jgi:hypothetical protein